LRFRKVIDDYQTTTHVPEALMRLTETYLALGVHDEAKKSAAVLGANYPGTDWYSHAYKLVNEHPVSTEAPTGMIVTKAPAASPETPAPAAAAAPATSAPPASDAAPTNPIPATTDAPATAAVPADGAAATAPADSDAPAKASKKKKAPVAADDKGGV
jgi:outer membrane protein assembly factor BamD